MIIYIRHGNDHSEGNAYHHDRGLSDAGKRRASKAAERLIRKHGHPTVAYASPFRRAVETLEAMTERFDRHVSVAQDVRIAQYFGKKKRKRGINIGPELAALVAIDADKAAFRLRVSQHVEEMKAANLHRSDVIVWCITHTAVLRCLGKQFDQRMRKPIEFLDYIVVGA
jgi:broad specificity phosphatase PhoE